MILNMVVCVWGGGGRLGSDVTVHLKGVFVIEKSIFLAQKLTEL